MTPFEAAKALADVMLSEPESLVGFDRSGTAAVVAEALTIATGRTFYIVMVPNIGGGASFSIKEHRS